MSAYGWGHYPNHPPCPGGCGELADECRCSRPNPLGSMRIVEPVSGWDCGSGRCDPNTGCPSCNDEPRTWNRAR